MLKTGKMPDNRHNVSSEEYKLSIGLISSDMMLYEDSSRLEARVLWTTFMAAALRVNQGRTHDSNLRQ